MLLSLIAAAAAGGSSDDSDATTDEDRQDRSETTSEPERTTSTEERTTSTEERTTTTAAPTTTTIPPPRVYEGTGDCIIQDLEWPTDAPLALATITYQGGSNFAVWGLDDGLQQNGLYVNTIGSYTGTVLFGSEGFGSDATGMQIQADGPWRVEIKNPLLARRFNGPVSGIGDDVIYYGPSDSRSRVEQRHEQLRRVRQRRSPRQRDRPLPRCSGSTI